MARFIKLTHKNGDIHLVNLDGIELCEPDPSGFKLNFLSGRKEEYALTEDVLRKKINVANNKVYIDIT